MPSSASRWTSFVPYVGAFLLVCTWAAVPAAAIAGGGPENVLLVVNRDSLDSMTIDNHYLRLRQISPANVVSLARGTSTWHIDVDAFRKEILVPVLKTIQQRHLGAQIDYIVYSCDFPTGIELDKDVERLPSAAAKIALPAWPAPSLDKATWPTTFTKIGSINGLTYLWEPVVAGNPLYMYPYSNQYLRQDIPQQKGESSLAFQSSLSFGPKGEVLRPAVSDGRRYVLSMMLGVTEKFGNSLQEVLDYLGRSASADGTHPRGTIYYAQNSDLRSKVRQDGFPAAVKQLQALGVEAKIVDGILPTHRNDVQGLMTGVAYFAWKPCGSTILPGAICEHFTSFGADRYQDQTKFSEFLRYGAAAASGTVVEPYSIPHKFPDAKMHVHYARGCTVAEAFYQSISQPYQLLIVGDPLCRPWANIPKVTVSGVEPGTTVRGPIKLKPAATFAGKSKVDHFELFVDELRKARCPADGSFLVETAQLADGYHELRIVAIEAGPIASQGRAILSITTANQGHTIEAAVEPKGTAAFDKPVVVTAKCPGSMGIVVMHNSHLLGKINGEAGRLEISPAALGLGPVLLRVVGLGDGTPINYVWAEPLEVTVEKR